MGVLVWWESSEMLETIQDQYLDNTVDSNAWATVDVYLYWLEQIHGHIGC